MTYEAVIGLEVHVELNTASKMFCGCPTTFGGEPNTQTCPVCLGHPGSLPVANERAVEATMLIGVALGCEIAPRSLFHRKNYFYPDMPKNYQISQYDLPLCVDGALEVDVNGSTARVGITRAHLEEDTGKSLHVGTTGRIAEATHSLVDYNRAGIPLVEIVSEPDIRSVDEAQAYLTELRSIVRTLGVSDVRMEEGSMRCDANVSLRPAGTEGYGVKVEIKNLNSIRSLGRALAFEIERQAKLLGAGETPLQETRHFDEGAGKTSTLRSKEEAFDYRYFPEPDLVPIEPGTEWVERLRASLPDLPRARRHRLMDEHGLDAPQAAYVANDPAAAAYFEGLLAEGVSPRDAAVWMIGELARALNEHGHAIEDSRIRPRDLGDTIRAVSEGTVNLNTAKTVLQEEYARASRVVTDVGTAEEKDLAQPVRAIKEKGLTQISDDAAIEDAVRGVLEQHAAEVERYRAGEQKVFGFLMGQAMKALKGQGAPHVVKRVLRDVLR